MAKGKFGLQKGVSSIFTGVQIPKAEPAEDALSRTPSGPAQFVPPKPIPSAERGHTPRLRTDYAPPVPARPESRTSVAPRPVKAETVAKTHLNLPWRGIFDKVRAKLATSKAGVNQGRQKAMLIVAPLLLVILIVVLTQVLSTPPRRVVKPTKTIAAALAAGGKINWELPSPYPANLRDPMKFGAVTREQKVETNTIVVKGIVYSEDKPAAVVGEDIVFEGDTVEGVTVVKINPDSVEFAMGEKKWTQRVER